MRHASPLFAVVPVALLLAACEAPTGTRQAIPVAPTGTVFTNEHFDEAVFAFNGCNGDFLTGTAKFHIVYGVTADASGGFHVNVKEQFSNIKLTAVPSGAQYVGSLEFAENLNLDAAQEETVEESLKLIGQGQTPNEVLHFLFHITVNANGEVTSVVDNFSFQCH